MTTLPALALSPSCWPSPGRCLSSAALVVFISPWFLLLTAFVGVNQWLYVLVGACPASLILKRAFGLRSVVYPPTGFERTSR